MSGANILADRAVVAVEGSDAAAFLDRIVTCGVDRVGPGTARFGALLSPQGKILADFLIFAGPDGSFLLDTPAGCAADLVRRLGLYRLRAKVTVTDRSGDLAITVGEAPDGALAVAPDPRLPALGRRAVMPRAELADAARSADTLRTERVVAGVPELGHDYAPGELFPHEALMDQLGGVDFDKGCYVGQEVVSRMQHRGTARTRFLSVRFEDGPPAPGHEVVAAERVLGRLAGTAGPHGLALLRVDRAADALAAGLQIRAADAALGFEKPDWVRFSYPAELQPASAA